MVALCGFITLWATCNNCFLMGNHFSPNDSDFKSILEDFSFIKLRSRHYGNSDYKCLEEPLKKSQKAWEILSQNLNRILT